MQQSQLWHDSVYDALGAAVEAAGGRKKVAAKLWPALDSDSATARLRGGLNPEHAQKLDPAELLMIGRLARDGGDDSLMQFFAREWGYEVEPLSAPEAKKRAKKQRVSALLAELSRHLDDE